MQTVTTHAERHMAASALTEEMQSRSVLMQEHSPVSLLQCLAQCFTATLINEQLIKRAMWESEEKRREGRRGKGGNFIQLI